MSKSTVFVFTTLLIILLSGLSPVRLFAQADLATSQQALAILGSKCGACHGAVQMSGLDLRQREAMLKGGKRGAAVKPGNPEESLLFQAAAHVGEVKMPPGSKSPLPSDELAVLKRWIREGAAWPAMQSTVQQGGSSWWSFRKLRRPPVPRPSDPSLAVNPIDAFVLAELHKKGLKAAPRADKLTLLRRAYFDLIGLPPTPEQMDSFLKDSSPNAYAKVIDELLASPRYGERWGRHWLDVARYADSSGFEVDSHFANAWRYRDYVIKSFNDDKPYDRFVEEQIAGDELWPDDLDLAGFYDVPLEKLEHLEARIGTTLYTMAPEIGESRMNARKLRYEWLTDTVDTTGSAFLGLTFMCARCHDHKFDPISQKDYFQLQAIFAASEVTQIPVVTGMSTIHREESYHTMIALDEDRKAHQMLVSRVKERVIQEKKKEFPAEVVKAYETPGEERTAQQVELAAPLTKAYTAVKVEEYLTPEDRPVYEQSIKRIVKDVLTVPVKDASHRIDFDGFFDVPSASVLGPRRPELIPDIYVLNRGDLEKNMQKALPGLPAALIDSTVSPNLQPDPMVGPRYRKQLALWLTRPDHPLTARVMVNRIWQGHFGRGIVGTPGDFGRQGQPPTNQPLLDWLAAEFVSRDWSIKSLHRLIMLSNTYQQSSQFVDSNNSRIDPDNLFLWRMNRRRLEAEAVWDSMHAVAGTLNLKMGGRSVTPPLPETELTALRIRPIWVQPADPAEANRRGIYIMVKRNFTFPMFDRFDVPDPASSCSRRDVTTVAPQALWALNNQISFKQAEHLAARVVQNGGEESSWIEEAWKLAVARPPSVQEKKEALALMEKLAQQGAVKERSEPLPAPLAKLEPSRAAALTKLCLTIFNLSEFVYID